MAIPTTRTRTTAAITVDSVTCSGCGLCVRVCKDFSLRIVDGKATVAPVPAFGCFGCGHCMAICPTGAITIEGRELSQTDLVDMPPRGGVADYGSLFNLFLSRRSIREFENRPVEHDLVNRILDAARTAPMGLPPSDVHVLILAGADVGSFARDFCAHLETTRWFVSRWFLTLMRPFWGKANDEVFRSFVRPVFDIYIEHMKKGENLVTYDAPLAMYFYGSPYADPADPLIAATYAMLAAESLDLGSCMLGAIHPLIQRGSSARALRKKYGIRHTSREGLFVVFGYPSVRYSKAIRRSFAAIDFYRSSPG